MKKLGDWRSIDGTYHPSLDAAVTIRNAFLHQHPEERTRIRSFSTLGYSIQHFVPRKEK